MFKLAVCLKDRVTVGSEVGSKSTSKYCVTVLSVLMVEKDSAGVGRGAVSAHGQGLSRSRGFRTISSFHWTLQNPFQLNISTYLSNKTT